MAFIRTFRSCIAFASFCIFATQAHAVYVWLEKDASGEVKASLGELNGKKAPVSGLSSTRAFLADGRDLGLTTRGETVSIATPTSGRDMRFTARGAGDKGGAQYFHARFGRTETKAVNDLELVPTEANGNTFKLYWKGNVVSASQVNVTTADGWTRVLRSEADGSMKLPTSVSGLYVLEVSVRVNSTTTAGNGKQPEDALHTATLSFTVDCGCK